MSFLRWIFFGFLSNFFDKLFNFILFIVLLGFLKIVIFDCIFFDFLELYFFCIDCRIFCIRFFILFNESVFVLIIFFIFFVLIKFFLFIWLFNFFSLFFIFFFFGVCLLLGFKLRFRDILSVNLYGLFFGSVGKGNDM